MLPATFDNLYKIFLAMDSINPSDRTESFNQYFKELTEILKEHYHEQRHTKQSENRQESDRDRQEFSGGTISS
jgi:endonuclease IV